MDYSQMIENVRKKKISVSLHAISRLHERNLFIEDVVEAIINGKVIEEYKDDYPYPSCLILGWVKGKAIHTVCSLSSPTYIIIAYEPTIEKWNDGFETRRK